MKRILSTAILASIALLAAPALADPATWSSSGRKAVCASGTCDAPTATDGTQGMVMTSVPRYAIQACADSGQTITAGTTGTVDVYYFNPGTQLWGIWRSYKVQTIAGTNRRCGWAVDDSPGFGIPNLVPAGIMAAVPTSIVVSSGGVTLSVMAVSLQGLPLY